jgi:hypothetical protein
MYVCPRTDTHFTYTINALTTEFTLAGGGVR